MSPSRATQMNQKALLSMLLGAVTMFCSCVTGIPALILGFRAIGEIERSRGVQYGRGMAFSGIVFALAGMAMSLILAVAAVPFLRNASAGVGGRVQNTKNLSRMTRAMLAYNDEHGHLPPRRSVARRAGRC
jgi:hypothetical protein